MTRATSLLARVDALMAAAAARAASRAALLGPVVKLRPLAIADLRQWERSTSEDDQLQAIFDGSHPLHQFARTYAATVTESEIAEVYMNLKDA